jgi:hypothetical protein
MSKVKIEGNASGTGTLTIAAPNTNTDRTLTLPDGAGEILLSDGDGSSLTNIPSIDGATFSSYQSTAQTITTGTWTKVNFQTESWDTDGVFASSRFTPTTEGYYQLTGSLRCSTGLTNGHISVWKNGSEEHRLLNITSDHLAGSCLEYANGTSDYFEIYVYHASGSDRTLSASPNQTYFQGVLVRKA